jgi:hypothetical protein
MVVCVEPELGYFFRINSQPKWNGPVLLRLADHSFLHHDSYLECGGPLDLDEYIVSEALRERGVIGRVSDTVVPDILATLEKAFTMTPADRDLIYAVLRRI